MKRKILAIALSLALLSSLFVFAVPVNAEPADQAEKFEYWADFVLVTNDPLIPDINNHNVMFMEAMWYYDVIDSSFGPGDMEIEWSVNANMQAGKYHTHSIVIYNFDQGGTITLVRNTDRVFVGPNPMTDWVLIRENIRVISATGCCEGIHFTEILSVEDPIHFETLMAHWAPKQ